MEIDVPPPEVRKKVYMATYESKTHEDIKKAYQSWAPFYELHIVDEGWKAPWLCANLLTKFETEQEAKILDVGAGTGLVGQALKELGYKNLHAADLSQDMLKQAAAKGVYSSVHETGAEDMPFEDASFDSVICVGALNFGHIPPSALQEMLRIVKTHGYVSFTTREDFYLGACQAVQDELVESGKWVLMEERAIPVEAVKDMPHIHWCYQKK